MPLTDSQRAAISARGNVLVVAGAGTGKTRTLVERCLSLVLHPSKPVSLTEILVVTFTEAAAAEMRERIRRALDERAREELNKTNANQALLSRLQEEQAMFEMAHIGTLHGFCLKLLREHFYLVGLDPQFTVMAEEEAAFLAQEELNNLLQEHYAGRTEDATAVQELIASHAGGSDHAIRNLVLRIHNYSQTLPNPAEWLNQQRAGFEEGSAAGWEKLFSEAVQRFIAYWREPLNSIAPANDLAKECAVQLGFIDCGSLRSEETLRDAFQKIVNSGENCPFGKIALWREPLEHFYSEAGFLLSLMSEKTNPESAERKPGSPSPPTPLRQDWQWVRPQMAALLRLVEQFTERFSAAKRELALVDFHDLEQFTLRVLWNAESDCPTDIAGEWQQRLQYVFVDEYQDINAAQDKILQLLSRSGPDANRFLVGDVKQSIYRFRLAAPQIFQNYARQWGAGNNHGCAIPLSDNFRSREGILNFVNSLFPDLMREDLGGVAYNEQARLRFGVAEERTALNAQTDSVLPVEVHLRLKRRGRKGKAAEEPDELAAQIADLQDADKEARLVAIRLGELKSAGHKIWDDQGKVFRPVDWKDMAILLRAPGRKAEAFAKEFSKLDIPLTVARGGFYQTTEITDLLSLLKILDNPLQDIPALAVLRSPLVGLTLDELATVRLAAKGHFWTALRRWHESQNAQKKSTPALPHSSTPAFQESNTLLFQKVSTFLSRFSEWRRLSRQVPLSWCLEAILGATHYADWLLVQPRGEQRHANLQRLIALARQFDHFQRQGLFRFLLFIDAQETAEADPPVKAAADENAVRLLSIHQSKGLEFPVVVLADLGKRFNVQDLRADVILDELYGICPRIKPPHTGKRYPSLPWWLARQRQRQELLGEELRLLYVALTRARDTLILTATISEPKLNDLWTGLDTPFPDAVEAASSVADWLGLWFAKNVCPRQPPQARGSNKLISWVIHDEASLVVAPVPQTEKGLAALPGATLREGREEMPPSPTLPPLVPVEERGKKGLLALQTPKAPELPEAEIPLEAWEKLREKLASRYPFVESTRQPAKSSVSFLRRQAAMMDDELSSRLINPDPNLNPDPDLVSRAPTSRSNARPTKSAFSKRRAPKAPAVDVGSAMHAFLQFVALDSVGTRAQLEPEVARLVNQKVFTPEEAALLDLGQLERFWQSDFGQTVQRHRDSVIRELPFTFKLPLPLFRSVMGRSASPTEAPGIAKVDPPLSGSAQDDFIVVQGIADLVLLLPNEIQIVDFKTDRLTAAELPERARQYEAQLKLYSLALSEIYRRPVSKAWLYFLVLGEPWEVVCASELPVDKH